MSYAVGQKIRSLRVSRGWTLEQFGEHVIPVANKSNVLRWENGSSVPNASRLKSIAEMGGITVDELLKSELKICEKCNFDMLKKHYIFCPLCGTKKSS